MHAFTYLNATEIVFGKDTELQTGELMKKLGKKILLHYGGGSIMRSGLYDRVKASLYEAGLEVVELGGVKPNPRIDLVREGIALCRREGVDAILAVGGGSVIDSAKAIGVGVPVAHDVWDFYLGKAPQWPEQMLPLGVVLTIPAAGSETSTASVISNPEDGKKLGLGAQCMRPQFCILNPQLNYTLPAYQTACGASDMLAHVMERYFSTEAGDLTDRLCEATMQTIIKFAPLAIQNPEDYDVRAEILWAGTVAHGGLLGTGRTEEWSAHNIEHELSAMYDIAHGAGLAIVFPAWMKHALHSDVMRFAQFAQRVFGISMDYQQPVRTALEGIAQLERWYTSIGMPVRLSQAGITDEHLTQMAENCARDNGDGTQGVFCVLDTDAILSILKLAL